MNGKVKKEVIEQTLMKLAAKGTVTPSAVVESARKKTSPLHECFEWDDIKAGEKFRLTQARQMIRSVQLVIINETRILATVAFVRDPDAGAKEQGYVPTAVLQNDEDRARAALLNEVDRVDAYLTRIHSLAIAFGLEEEIGSILDRFAAFRERVTVD